MRVTVCCMNSLCEFDTAHCYFTSVCFSCVYFIVLCVLSNVFVLCVCLSCAFCLLCVIVQSFCLDVPRVCIAGVC